MVVHPLTAWRETKGLRKADVARLLGITWRSVHRIERFEVRPSMAVGTGVETITAGDVTCKQLVDAFAAERAERLAPKPEAAA